MPLLAHKFAISEPEPLGSYSTEDVVFLLKDITAKMHETDTEERERIIQSGGHYSEMLPIEYKPSQAYLDLFFATLQASASKVALAVGVVAEQIFAQHGKRTVLVSLARAGTPIGILVKRYLKQIYGFSLPHYSISIIRDKGLDENAILYILQKHPHAGIQFIDGWTGKGAIAQALIKGCRSFSSKYGYPLDPDLAVLADPGQCVVTYGTREDFLIPSACLNSTVSGLLSRTVCRSDLIGEADFHGVKFYRELAPDDLSQFFVDSIADCFAEVKSSAQELAARQLAHPPQVTWQGLRDIQAIQRTFDITDINLVKPGVGETTRVLLRRIPWRILVDNADNNNLKHILLLARDRGVHIEVYPGLTYSCCGVIKPVKREKSCCLPAI